MDKADNVRFTWPQRFGARFLYATAAFAAFLFVLSVIIGLVTGDLPHQMLRFGLFGIAMSAAAGVTAAALAKPGSKIRL